MRIVSMISISMTFLLCGCTTFDQLAANGHGYSGSQRIYLSGTDSISVSRSEDLDGYACHNHQTVICEAWGAMLECVCGRFSP